MSPIFCGVYCFGQRISLGDLELSLENLKGLDLVEMEMEGWSLVPVSRRGCLIGD